MDLKKSSMKKEAYAVQFSAWCCTFTGALFPNDLAEDPNEDDVFNREEVVTPKDINVHSTLDGAIGEGEGDRSHDPLILHDLTDKSSGADTDGIPLHDMVSIWVSQNTA